MKLYLSILLFIFASALAHANETDSSATSDDHGVERGKVNFTVYENTLDSNLKARVNSVMSSRCNLNEVISLSVSHLEVQVLGTEPNAAETIFVFTILIEKQANAVDGSVSRQNVRLVLRKEILTGEFRDDFFEEASFSTVCK